MVLDGCPMSATADIGHPSREASLVVCSRATVLDRRSMRAFVLPIQGREGPGSSQADPLPLLRLQPGRRYGSDGME
jgi:hypothetical protein